MAEEADRIIQVDLPESISDEEETTPAADNGSRQSSNTVKPPAICVPNINNPHALELALNSCAGESNYTLRTSKFGVSRIYTVNSEAFRAVVRKLTSLNCKFWHHQLKEDKPYRVVLKGMHASVPKEQIKNAFADLGYETLNIYCPRKGDWQNEQICDGDDEATINHRTRQNLFFVNLKYGLKISEVLKVTQLGRHRVTIERARRRKEVLQCLRCHIFGHSKNYCLQDPICGKCAGPHATGSTLCTSDNYLCINCGGNHASTDKNCPVRIEKGKSLSQTQTQGSLLLLVKATQSALKKVKAVLMDSFRLRPSEVIFHTPILHDPKVLNLDHLRLANTTVN